MAELALLRQGLVAPELAMGKEGWAIHEQGFDMRKMAAQFVENGEPVAVDVTQIVNPAVMQPAFFRTGPVVQVIAGGFRVALRLSRLYCLPSLAVTTVMSALTI